MKKRILLLALVTVVLLAMSLPMAFAGKPVNPAVNITEPANGATVSGTTVTISADCTSGSSDETIIKVEYSIDGGTAITMSGPDGSQSGTWSSVWDSTAVSDGDHTITVTAYNSKRSASQSITVTVSNGGGGDPSDPHADLLWADYPSNCLSCHETKFQEMYQSVHYQWQGDSPDMVNAPEVKQGKINNSVNSYCINILGNWKLCGKCHVGRGAQPEATSNPTTTQLENIDCLMCHNEDYALVRDRQSDGSMGPPSGTDEATLNSYVRNIHRPVKTNCLKCHAFAGGGDAVKRGDLAWAHKNTGDSDFDVHMSTSGPNLICQDCHTFVNHKVTGKGSDLRPTDYASEVKCTKCHTTKEDATGHATVAINTHVARVACQTCHIPVYAKNASDSAADEATEVHRSWLDTSHHGSSPPYHPGNVKANNLIPKYKFWDRTSDNYLLYDVAVYDPVTAAYPTSRPVGSIDGPLGNKLYPFKYKTAEQPIRDATGELIALDTFEYILTSGDPYLATEKGLANMGYSSTDAYSWIITDTYQLLNHEVATAAKVLQCDTCHENTTQMNLAGELGYNLKDSEAVICSQCHKQKSWKGYEAGHDRHVTRQGYDCSWCHSFSRPERGLTMP